MVKFSKLIAKAEEKLECVHADIRERDKKLIEGAGFSIKVGGMTFAERVDGGMAFLSVATQWLLNLKSDVCGELDENNASVYFKTVMVTPDDERAWFNAYLQWLKSNTNAKLEMRIYI